MELKDIILKKGDIVYLRNEYKTIIDDYDSKNVKEVYGDYLSKIAKIERPHYETIYEIPKELLDKEEKEYLENFLRPFKDRVNYIKIAKRNQIQAFMIINVDIYCNDYDSESIFLPKYRLGIMYKGMEIDKRYTLEELGLFKE